MKIQFEVAGVPAEYTRDVATGSAKLKVGDQKVTLQSVFDPLTYWYPFSSRSWERTFGDHVVRVEKRRPIVYVARGNSYRIFVDGKLVVEEEGY